MIINENDTHVGLRLGSIFSSLLTAFQATRYHRLMSENLSFAPQFREILRLESQAIASSIERIQPDSIDRAIQLLAACTGKITITGVGKSGLIGRKIAATMTSTGTTAVFLHRLIGCSWRPRSHQQR